MYYVYLIQNAQLDLYTGSTNNLKRRFQEHNSGKSFYTRGNKWELIYYEAYLTETDARQREHQLKHHGQAMAQLKRRLKTSIRKS